ncbi:MAG: glycogen debranching enzyme family protein [Thermovirga sp.]|nr:glycogen debranching enzyme family protein [Thermovirga sp.]
MYYGKADVNTFERGASREFLVSNGKGGYAFSTVIGANTRKEHGLLVVPGEKTSTPTVYVSKVEETLFARNKKYQLSTNQYKETIYPDGYRYIQEYEESPLPTTLYVIYNIMLKKTIFMPKGLPCTVIKYELLTSHERMQLEIRPLCAHRGIDSTLESETFEADISKQVLSVSGNKCQSHLYATKGEWIYKPLKFENVIYTKSESNGNGKNIETLWSPGLVSLEMGEGDTVYIAISSEPMQLDEAKLANMEAETVKWLKSKTKRAPTQNVIIASELMKSASNCIKETEDGEASVISGYPSVKELSRDAFIALPGLTRANGDPMLGFKVLKTWLSRAKECGYIMPSEIDPVTKEPKLAAADCGLWFIYAFAKLMDQTESSTAMQSWWDDLKLVVDKYFEGIPKLDLVCADDGLLEVKTNNPERNWMNGAVDSKPVVERRGKLVEINALWYFVLREMEQYSDVMEEENSKKKYGEMANKVASSFPEVFWKKEGYLKDWVDGNECDDAIRCNQILAVSLPVSPLDPERGRSVVETCWRELYTTYGLRTLDPHHDKYKGRCEGRRDQKEKARFRGMAWPWLLGQFISAFVKFNPDKRDIVQYFIKPFRAHLRRGCIGGIAENFDGSMPYLPHGDVVSILSVGEVLRVIYEDLAGI